MRNVIFYMFTGFLLSCSSSGGENQSLSQMKDSVLEVHDDVMPKMGELRKLEKNLREGAMDLQDSLVATKMLRAADRVKNASDGMMVWMRNFDPDVEGNEEEIRTYLKDQKIKIIQVRDDMLESLDSGRKLLEDQGSQ